jgi:replicative DNA helicase
MANLIHISQAYQAALDYMQKRKVGDIRSIKTPWARMNQVTMDGFEWNNIIVIGGRPGSGKTMLTNLITREAFKLNPDQHFGVLDFQFEMIARTIAMRELSGAMKKSMKQLASCGEELSNDDLDAAILYTKEHGSRNIWTIDKPMTVKEIEVKIEECIAKFNMPFIVTLDHSVLVSKSSSEKDQFDTLHNLAKMMTRLKKHPVMFIVLTQLNREVESIDRQKPGTYGNYIFDSDIYGGDALLQHADIVLGINRPSKYNLRVYGPEKYQVSPKHIVVHYLKNRNGQAGQFSFFEEDFQHMRLYEVDPPPRTII